MPGQWVGISCRQNAAAQGDGQEQWQADTHAPGEPDATGRTPQRWGEPWREREAARLYQGCNTNGQYHGKEQCPNREELREWAACRHALALHAGTGWSGREICRSVGRQHGGGADSSGRELERCRTARRERIG